MKPMRHNTAKSANTDDRGFVLIMVGLLIVPIVAFSALAIDVSAWYSRATELQRSADAAALAGVVWMPHITDSQSVAEKVLVSNGLTIGGDISVTMAPGEQPNSFKVCVKDSHAPQFFSVVFSGPVSLTRCATAQYDLPLELGSPLNYYGGNASDNFGSTTIVTGTHDISSRTPKNTGNPEAPNNYATAKTNPPDSQSRGCRYWTSRNTSYNPDRYWGYWWDTAGNRHGGTNSRLDSGTAARVWNSGGWHYAVELPDCLFTHTVEDTEEFPNNPIPEEKSPNFWAAISGPGMFSFNGDAYAPRCKTSGGCSSNSNSMYRPTGYYFSLDVPSGTTAGNISLQVFDAAQSSSSGTKTPTGDVRYGGNQNQETTFTLYNAGLTPYDMGDDVQVSGCTLTTNGPNSAYDKKWVQICSFTPVVGQRYYLNVKSANSSANTYNGYALRAVAGTFPASCLSSTLPQRRNVDCYGDDPQPRLSGYGDMEMYNGIPQGIPTNFFIANVLRTYAGRTLVIELWDPGDGAKGSEITVMRPYANPSDSADTEGTEQKGCRYRAWDPDSDPGGYTTINDANDCTISMSGSGSGSTSQYNGKWVQIKVQLPVDYTCDKTANPETEGGSCWWQIRYRVTGGSLSDYTTWTARIEGDPVRLIK